LSRKKKDSDENRKEELRGLFTLGLLAVLVAVRLQNEKLMVTIGQSSLDFIPFVNMTIIMWSLYAFFMILGLSDDVIGENLAEMFRRLSKLFLQILSSFYYSVVFLSR